MGALSEDWTRAQPTDTGQRQRVQVLSVQDRDAGGWAGMALEDKGQGSSARCGSASEVRDVGWTRCTW